MQSGFKCDFCSEFSGNISVIEKHEVKCGFNPLNKTCYTCNFYSTFYSSDICKLEENMNDLDGCHKWELEQILRLKCN